MGYSAAEVERYTYCPLSWWLSHNGVDGEDDALRAGIVKHNDQGRRLGQWQRVLKTHKESVETSLYLALVAASAATLAIEVTFLDWHGIANRILMLLSLFWLLVSLGFLARALITQESAFRIRIDAGIVEGDLTYSDLDRPGAVLRSAKYDLGGKPDYIVRRKGGLIPVEVKSGKTPETPHESHIMQLAAYCVLVEEAFEERPGFGVISYDDKKFEVPYTEELKDRVLETVLRMRLADLTRNVHRNHDRPGKCRHCSRRSACPERIV